MALRGRLAMLYFACGCVAARPPPPPAQQQHKQQQLNVVVKQLVVMVSVMVTRLMKLVQRIVYLRVNVLMDKYLTV